MIYHDLLYKAAHKVDWRKVGAFLSYPDKFDEEAFRQSLLSWIRSLCFYDKGMTEERIRLKMLALFNYLWESNREVLSNAETPWPRDVNTNSDVGFYSILPLLFYETSMWEAPQFFWGNGGNEADAIRRRDPGEQDHEMLGVMENLKMHEGYGKFDVDLSVNKDVLAHLHKHQWIRPYQPDPAPVLGLSFHAQGLQNVLGGQMSWFIERQSIAALSGWAIWSSHDLPYSDWPKRYLMFILAQRLYLYQNVCDIKASLERWLFSVLYLRYYRIGPDDLLGRPSLLKEWRSISQAKKESEAADSRRIFIETCNMDA